MKGYVVCDEFDYSKTFANRTDAVKECKRWRLEGRNAEVVRRVPDALADRPAAIIPRFYERSADQVFNHLQSIEVGEDVSAGAYLGESLRWYERSLDDWDAPTYEQPKLRGWLEREPELAMSPQELVEEHTGRRYQA